MVTSLLGSHGIAVGLLVEGSEVRLVQLLQFHEVVGYTIGKERCHVATTEATACSIEKVVICATGVQLAGSWTSVQLHRLNRVLGLLVVPAGCCS